MEALQAFNKTFIFDLVSDPYLKTLKVNEKVPNSQRKSGMDSIRT